MVAYICIYYVHVHVCVTCIHIQRDRENEHNSRPKRERERGGGFRAAGFKVLDVSLSAGLRVKSLGLV